MDRIRDFFKTFLLLELVKGMALQAHVRAALRAHDTTHNVDVVIEGAKTPHHAVLKEYQQHPVRGTITHVDFHEVDVNAPVVMKVPLETIGKSKAIVAGARLQIVLRTLNVRVKPGDVPEKIVFDTTDSDIGVVRAKSVVMPAGVTLLDDPELPVLSLRMPRGEKAEEPAAGTPAAAAAAAPAKKK